MITEKDYGIKNRKLFDRWKQKHSVKYGQVGFVTDGIIDTDFWFSTTDSEEKILFLLKEAFDSRGRNIDWDETKWIKQEKCMNNCTEKFSCDKCRVTGNTFNFVASVTYGITESSSNEYDDWLGINSHSKVLFDKKRQDLLKKIAVVNIKKSGGVSQSNSDDIYYFAADDKDFLTEQIELISPTLIICGGTYNYLRCIFTDLPRLENASNGSCVFNSIKIIASEHPNSHSRNDKKYNDIIKNYKNLK